MAKVTMTSLIRDYAAAFPEATAKEIATNVGCPLGYVHGLWYRERLKAEATKKRGRPAKAKAVVDTVTNVTYEDMQEITYQASKGRNREGTQVPTHYGVMKIQPVEFITANNISFLEGCIIKRICRWRNKDGIQDLQKIKHEIDLLIELESKKT
jgi:hypothetical protein